MHKIHTAPAFLWTCPCILQHFVHVLLHAFSVDGGCHNVPTNIRQRPSGAGPFVFCKVSATPQEDVCTTAPRPAAEADHWKSAGSAATWTAGVGSLVEIQGALWYVITAAYGPVAT